MDEGNYGAWRLQGTERSKDGQREGGILQKLLIFRVFGYAFFKGFRVILQSLQKVIIPLIFHILRRNAKNKGFRIISQSLGNVIISLILSDSPRVIWPPGIPLFFQCLSSHRSLPPYLGFNCLQCRQLK